MAFNLSKIFATFDLIGVNDGDRDKPVEFLIVGADLPAQRANAALAIAAWLTDFNGTNTPGSGASGAWVTDYTYSEKWYEDQNVPAFSGWEDLYKEVVVTSQLDDDPDEASIYIPAPRNVLFVGDSFNSSQVDSSSAELLAFANNYINDGSEMATLANGKQWQSPLNVTGVRLRSVRSGKSY